MPEALPDPEFESILVQIGGRKLRLLPGNKVRAAVLNGDIQRDTWIEVETADGNRASIQADDEPFLRSLLDQIDAPAAPKPVDPSATNLGDDKNAANEGPRKAAGEQSQAAGALAPGGPLPVQDNWPDAVPEFAEPDPDTAPFGHENPVLGMLRRSMPWPLLMVAGIIVWLAYGLFPGSKPSSPDLIATQAASTPQPLTKDAEADPAPKKTDKPEPTDSPKAEESDQTDSLTTAKKRRESVAAATSVPAFLPVAAPPPPPVSLAKPVAPLNQSSLRRRIADSYPSQAIDREQEGQVGVRLTIGTNGQVTACSVVSSSGYAILDSAACNAMKRHAKFSPALDDSGNPVMGSYATSVEYRLSDD